MASGSAPYVLQYRIGDRESQTRRYTIGGHGSPWTPATARAEAARLLMYVLPDTKPLEQKFPGLRVQPFMNGAAAL
jgi:hypothetical protein